MGVYGRYESVADSIRRERTKSLLTRLEALEVEENDDEWRELVARHRRPVASSERAKSATPATRPAAMTWREPAAVTRREPAGVEIETYRAVGSWHAERYENGRWAGVFHGGSERDARRAAELKAGVSAEHRSLVERTDSSRLASRKG